MMWKILTMVLLFSTASNSVLATEPSKGEVPTVTSVDLEHYQGLWHEIATIPMWFQRKCVSNVTAEYKALENGMVDVANSCDQADGSRKAAHANARLNPNYGDKAKLQVTFVQIFGLWLWVAAGDYWIIDLGANYDYAVVGHPKRTYGWILSRSRTLERETLLRIREKLVSVDYDPCLFIMSQNDDHVYKTGTRLCDL
jgi:apolipoprotein D and lipocalin family protein